MNEQDIIPVGARCLIKVHQAAERRESGLVLDTSSSNSAAPVKGDVISAGDGSQFKEGDVVLFRRYSVDEIKSITSEGEKVFYFVEDVDVLGKLKRS